MIARMSCRPRGTNFKYYADLIKVETYVEGYSVIFDGLGGVFDPPLIDEVAQCLPLGSIFSTASYQLIFSFQVGVLPAKH